MNSDFASKKNTTVVLHNDFINSCYTMSNTHLRLFKVMLFNLNRENTSFTPMAIKNTEFLSTNSGSCYEALKNSTKNTDECLINGDKIFGAIEYASYAGYTNVVFSPTMEKYLLGLDQNSVKQGNWTPSRVEEIKKIKTFFAFRVYWLLKQYLNFKGNACRTIPYVKLKEMLGVSDKYDSYHNFKRRVLDSVMEELADTDVAFTYDVTRIGRSIENIKFFYKKVSVSVEENSETFGDWSTELANIGITRSSMVAINALLQENIITTDYIEYCVIHYKAMNAKKKINSSLKGAIFSAITGQYLTDDFKAYKKRKTVTVAQKANPKPKATETKKQEYKTDTLAIATRYWSECQDYIKTFVGEQSYNTFFSPIKGVEFTKKDKSCLLVVSVPNMLIYEWIEENYISTLRDALVNVLGVGAQIEYVLPKN